MPIYNQEIESSIYQLWEKSGFFNPDNLKPKNNKKYFSIIMPPPNANGALHIGHAVFITLQDIMIRYKRLQGFKTLWLPGADHAGFETQIVYDKKLEKEGRNRFQIPSQKLYEEMFSFTMASRETMEKQLKQLGASCDWSRKKFTLDNDIIKIVYKTFKKLKIDGLIYSGKRVVNWCVKHQTVLSDIEIKHESRQANLYYVKYFLLDEKNNTSNDYLTIATTRPETIPADIALAVNSQDERYKKYIGQYVINPLNNNKLMIVADRLVDKDFGTGVLKITPDHDRFDEELYLRHPEILASPKRIINIFGKLEGENIPQELLGLKVLEARIKTEELFSQKKILDVNYKEKGIDRAYINSVAVCYKCHTVIEPLSLDNQLFVKMDAIPKNGGKSLKELGLAPVQNNKIKFIPARFKKTYIQWIKDIKDWNISRDIVWGIKIPDQNNNVFDTWFSSGQWPLATLMTGRKNDIKKFYPTDVMETGYDILFFWVGRMVILSMYVTGKIPFKCVYLNGMVRDKDKQKMSKSKGNVIDPLGIVELYGADALRIALVMGNAPGNDVVISEEKIRGYRNFTNKIWNAAYFIQQNIKSFANVRNIKLNKNNKAALKELKITVKKVTKNMNMFKFHLAAEFIYHYFWHTFCDKIIEQNKVYLKSNNINKKKRAQVVVFTIFKTCIQLLHPFMPFVTEAVWQQIINPIIKNNKDSLLMASKWPK